MTDHTQSVVGFIIAIILVGVLAIIALWDSYCLVIAQRTDWTVSYYLHTWSRQFPLLILATGIVIGHVVWPLTLPSIVKEVTNVTKPN